MLGAEREHVADLGLPDELLVEVADVRAAVAVADLVVAAIGDRTAGVVKREHGALACADGAGQAVVVDARLQGAHARATVAARELFEHAVEGVTAEIAVRV